MEITRAGCRVLNLYLGVAQGKALYAQASIHPKLCMGKPSLHKGLSQALCPGLSDSVPFPSGPEAQLCESLFSGANVSFFRDAVTSQRAKRKVIPSAPGLTAFTRPVRGVTPGEGRAGGSGPCPLRRHSKGFILTSVTGPVPFNIFAAGLGKGI